MKSLMMLIGCFVAAAANASAVYPSRLPHGEYADTEATAPQENVRVGMEISGFRIRMR